MGVLILVYGELGDIGLPNGGLEAMVKRLGGFVGFLGVGFGFVCIIGVGWG